jgi:hypothetical protein
MEKLLDVMLSVWDVPRLYIEDQTEAEESVRARVLKTPRAVRQIWSWVPWDSKPRITVLVRASSN